MNISEFKGDEGLVTNWRAELKQNQTLQHALEAMETDSPINGVTTETDPLIILGEIKGYQRYGKGLFDLAQLAKMPEQLQNNYGVKRDAK